MNKTAVSLLTLGIFTGLNISLANAEVKFTEATIKEALEKAYATENQLVIEATLQSIKKHTKKSKKLTRTTNKHFKKLKSDKIKLAKDKLAKAIAWTGEVEGGLELKSGNTKRRTVNGGVSIGRKVGDWAMNFGFTAENVSENKIRTEEEYHLTSEVEYKINEHSFSFAEVDLEKNSFAEYDYKIVEIIGYGHKPVNNDKVVINIKAGVGGRHSLNLAADSFNKEHEAVFKPSVDLTWKINGALEFYQEISSEISNNLTTTESETTLKSQIMNNLYLKATLELEHNSEVSADREKLDTTSILGLAYKF